MAVDQNVRYLTLPECQDDEHDACPEFESSILMPGRIVICDCSCHDPRGF